MNDGIIHRNAVRDLLISPRSGVLMMQIRDPETAHRFWITPGGGLLDDETPETGLRRELSEEVGCGDFTVGPMVWKRQHTFNWAGRSYCQGNAYPPSAPSDSSQSSPTHTRRTS